MPDTCPTTTFAFRIKLSISIKDEDIYLTNELPG
jgi:hypothetical protein